MNHEFVVMKEMNVSNVEEAEHGLADDTSSDELEPVDDHMEEEHELSADDLFQFEPLSEQKIAQAAESYRIQEQAIERNHYELDNLDQIILKNSDPLPNRTFAGINSVEMCESGQAECVQPFAKIRPLIVTSPNHHLMSCLIQKTMSTVMSAIFCFLVREKEFIDAGRSILREYPDIRWVVSIFLKFSVIFLVLHTKTFPSITEQRRRAQTHREPYIRFYSLLH
ncbi:hypothetical protein COOONC_25864, partial [Cooperia oncophora]